MRHLFGTWKGVFPPQSLQMIEKELGFATAANGSSSGAATSRPDAQSRRPQRSIHVNPKYLEIQSLQQSGRPKGLANDSTVPLANTTEDAGSAERVVGIGAGRAWVDPPVKIQNIQHSHRETLSEPVHEKKSSAVYGDFEYSSDISRNLGVGIERTNGRVTEQGYEKPWYGAANGVSETISGQKNGLSMKHAFPNLSTPKSANVDLHLQPTQGIVSKSSSPMSGSWKNSEEEEFMWDMHSRLSDQDAANLSNNSRKDHWTPDDSEKFEFENQLRKPQSAHEVVSSFDRETSSDSLSTEHKEQVSLRRRLSSPWRLKDSHPTDGPIISGTSIINAGQKEGYSATFGGLPMNSYSSLPKVAIRQHTGTSGSGLSANTSLGSGQQGFQSIGAASPSRQLPMRRHPPSLSFPARSRQQLQSSVEQDLSRPDYKAQQLSGNLLHSNVQLGNLQKLHPEDLPTSSPSLPSFQNSRQYPMSQPRQVDSKQLEPSGHIQKTHLTLVPKVGTPSSFGMSTPDHSTLLSAETSGQSSTSSLLAAVMSSGILSNITTVSLPNQSFQDVRQNPLDLSIQPSIPSGPLSPQIASSGPRVKSVSAPLSHDITSVTSNVSQRKEEQPPLPRGPPPSSVQTSSAMNKEDNQISNLLSSLVAKGLISASKSETLSLLPPQLHTQSQTQNLCIANSSNTSTSSLPISSAIPCSSTKDEVSLPRPDAKESVVLPQCISAEIKSLIGLEFKSDIIRELHPPVICSLFDDLLHQCSICGLKLKHKERLDRHLEWHTWGKPEPDGINKITRRWYASSGDWITGKAELPFRIESSVFTDELVRTMDENEPMVPADEDQCVCVLCGELFEDYYSHEKKKWMFKAAVHLSLTLRDGGIGTASENAEGPIVHVNCISESSVHDLGLASGIEMDKDG
ncbi:polyadenylation and cleavage factor homolog 4 isoform X2 [Hevea brasiliensis]|nr:polyadenylation and cleavage factor homolog 4 isoform X2 [Hevea brasiliensis]